MNMTFEEYKNKVKDGIVTNDGKCPVTFLLNKIQGKWKNHVLYEMCIYDTVRFGTLKKDLPEITNTMLSQTLKELEKDGFITKKEFNEVPPHTEYSLTKMGKDLLPIFYEMTKWRFKYIK